MKSYEKIAKILRTDKDVIRVAEERLTALTGKVGVLDKIMEENWTSIDGRLNILGLTRESSAKEVYEALIRKIDTDDASFYNALGQPQVTEPADWQRVLDIIVAAIKPSKGFFLKKEKAIEFLRAEPPLKVIEALGYDNVDELIAHEDLMEIYCALRFLQGGEWLNTVFFKQYEKVTPDDFEERDITPIALQKKWGTLAEGFMKKKYHNISHLKEMGIIYVIPLPLEVSGETLRNLALLLHYFNEIPFYSDIIRKFANMPETFVENLKSLLRGDVLDTPLPEVTNKMPWMVVQRYLAKEDEYDWRLFGPHINPEALHWEKAEHLLMVVARSIDGFSTDLAFWKNLNWVGDYFKSDAGIDVLVSFNLVDTAMSLVQEKEMVKYLYHHQESMWNKIFLEYFGQEEMEAMMKEYIIKGYFEI
jgi:predicted transcriptional regulator